MACVKEALLCGAAVGLLFEYLLRPFAARGMGPAGGVKIASLVMLGRWESSAAC